MRTKEELEVIAKEIRLDVFRMFYKSITGHLAPALSCLDIFTVLFFAPVISWDNRFSDNRDRVVLSKGHACASLYACLARAGYFSRSMLLSFYQRDSLLGGHPNVNLNGIETATGSLGHGICFGTGTAKASQLLNQGFRTYVVIGDGECGEGSVWEAAMFAANQKLDNLTVILDRNGLQASDKVDEIASLGKIEEKWAAFGWNVITVDGHDVDALVQSFGDAKETKGKPTVIIANTVKGKGLPIAENNPDWHSRAPKGEEWNAILDMYGISLEELEII